MKKTVLVILCAALFLAGAGGGAAYMLLTPRGALRSDGPDEVMQSTLDSMDRAALREEYVRLCPAETTEFEDAAAVAGHIFDAAVPGDRFTFRSVEGNESDTAEDYIISAGDTDILGAHLSYAGGRWNAEFMPLGSVSAAARTLSVTVPEGTALLLNGRPVDEKYIAERDLPYPDMSELELRFDSYPRLVRFNIPGIYEDVTLEAQREGGVTELYSDGFTWEFTLPDAGGCAMSVTAPGEAAVTVNGAQLQPGDITAVSSYMTRLDVPGELQGFLPSFSIYTAGGLYTQPVISAVMPDGTVLTPETDANGAVSFPLPGSQALYDTHHERVEAFLKALCEYGAGHTGRYAPGNYTVSGTGFDRYLWNAIDSLHWTVGVTVSYDEISSRDYVALGEDGFICTGHVRCTTKTRYQTVDLDMSYEMLWVRSNGNWLVQDLAFMKTPE